MNWPSVAAQLQLQQGDVIQVEPVPQQRSFTLLLRKTTLQHEQLAQLVRPLPQGQSAQLHELPVPPSEPASSQQQQQQQQGRDERELGDERRQHAAPAPAEAYLIYQRQSQHNRRRHLQQQQQQQQQQVEAEVDRGPPPVQQGRMPRVEAAAQQQRVAQLRRQLRREAAIVFEVQADKQNQRHLDVRRRLADVPSSELAQRLLRRAFPVTLPPQPQNSPLTATPPAPSPLCMLHATSQCMGGSHVHIRVPA